MAFVNEYIPEEDYEKYDLRRICGEHNLPRHGIMHSQSWTIDRDREAFLIKTWSHHESRFEGCAFYWKGEWIFFEMAVKKAVDNLEEDSCWSLYHIRSFLIPPQLESKKDEVISDFREAYSAYAGGGVFGNRTHRSATIEFINEPTTFAAPSFFVQPSDAIKSIKE